MKQQSLTHSDTIELILENSFNCESSMNLNLLNSIIAFISVCAATTIPLNNANIQKSTVPNRVDGPASKY